ncbi:MAG: hypothetical protein AAF694_18230 [Bacteroidota bacterium]
MLTPHIPADAQLSEEQFESRMDNYLPIEFRHFIEENFYGPIGEQAKLEYVKKDPDFYKNPARHIALFTDHSIVHVRDVAVQVLEVVKKVNGQLIPFREKDELEFLRACCLHLTYLHDIGMSDFSPFGRFMHPEFAAQYVFSPVFDTWVDFLWEKNSGNMSWMLSRLFKGKWEEERLKLLLREVLALSVAHSKSKVPIEIVSNPLALRERMLNVLSKPLPLLYAEQKVQRLQKKLEKKPDSEKSQKWKEEIALWENKRKTHVQHRETTNSDFSNRYSNEQQEAYQWLTWEEEPFRRFIIHTQDAIRCLRTADALRQRGTVLRTSAGYEIFIDGKTANAIYALRNETDEELYLLETRKSVNAGEANLASSEIDACGNLRVSFHLGAFSEEKITRKAARNAAAVIDDIQADTIQSFLRNHRLDANIFSPPKIAFKDIQILVEGTDDNPNFAAWVCEALNKKNPENAFRVQESFSLQTYDLEEVQRYLDGETLTDYLQANPEFRQVILNELRKSGFEFAPEKSIPGEADIRLIHLANGAQLIKGGSTSGFVYFPIAEGLRVFPLGGYESRMASAWVPLGNTGVIRGSIRNAHVFAETATSLICVPKSIYLKHWYHPLTSKDLAKMWWKGEDA